MMMQQAVGYQTSVQNMSVAVNDAKADPEVAHGTALANRKEEDRIDEAVAGKDGIVPLSGEVFGMLINLSGRRRFTSQRLVLYAVLGAQGRENATSTAREALKLFREAHQLLMRPSGQLPGVFCHELEQAYFGTQEGDRKIRHFMDLAERAINAIDDKLRHAPQLLEELVDGTTALLAVLNQLTAIYEAESKKHARLMRAQLHGVMTDIETIAREAKMVAFNARIVAARAGEAGKEFSVVAGVLSRITGEIDDLVKAALEGAVA